MGGKFRRDQRIIVDDECVKVRLDRCIRDNRRINPDDIVSEMNNLHRKKGCKNVLGPSRKYFMVTEPGYLWVVVLNALRSRD
jgi:hypothetical protein